MGKNQFEYSQRLSAPGKVDDWIDASEVALDYGTFEKIRLNHKGNQMRAQYGADDIVIDFRKKNASEVSLTIKATNEKVMNWYKACVTDVVCHPQNYADYYAGNPQGDASDRGGQEQGRNSDVGSGKKFYTTKWFMILMMILLPPAGLFLYFKYHRAGLVGRVLITALMVFYTLFIWLGFFGLNTGFGLSTITGFWQKKAAEPEVKVQQTQRTEEPIQEYVGE